ncbi:MAG: hypothetical protein H8E13_09460 [Actinobacteria bacterium]|nr:hypothetical protein [Actinomycetota bacterium]
MKLIDKKCKKCGRVYTDLFDIDNDKCECGSPLIRIFSFTRIKPFQSGFYENFELEPIYIEDRKQFKQECDKRGLVRVF